MRYLAYTKCCKIPRKRKLKQQLKMDLQTIINDLDIVKEAINNGNSFDAVAMLVDIQQDLKIISSLSGS